MDELQTALAEDIEAMDLGDEAKASAQATIQGFIDGAVGMPVSYTQLDVYKRQLWQAAKSMRCYSSLSLIHICRQGPSLQCPQQAPSAARPWWP